MDVPDASPFESDRYHKAFRRLGAEDRRQFRAKSPCGPYRSIITGDQLDTVDGGCRAGIESAWIDFENSPLMRRTGKARGR